MYPIFVQVIVNYNSKSTDAIYTYGVKECFLNKIKLGKRVKVTFSNKKEPLDALVVKIIKTTELPCEKIKPILDVIDEEIIIKEEMISLAVWMRDRYICKYSDVIKLMIPSQIKMNNIDKKLKYEKYLSLKVDIIDIEENSLNRAPKQKQIIELLCKNGSMYQSEMVSKYNISVQAVKALYKKGFIDIDEKVYNTTNSDNKECLIKKLNDEQQKCYSDIINSKEKVFLLHGVTGSGKTEVYISIVDYYRKLGKQCIVLVPEISLTSQNVTRFKIGFGDRVALLHSKLTQKQRYIEWLKILHKEVDVVIGARSAVFAPIKDLGAIIVDEEHEESYKSSSSPKYDAVETAIKRGYNENAKVILGSATPSLKTYNLCKKNYVKLLQIKKRANDSLLPQIKIVDMRKELDNGNDTVLSVELYKRIKNSLKNNEQIILFVNRRGYSSFTSCKKCGYVVKCKNCDVSMTYHNDLNKLKCHYCGNTISIFDKCPECGSDKFSQYGFGTQQVEEFIKHVFKDASVCRVDTDTMLKKGSFDTVYKEFKDGNIDILIGTQMLAKGLDFPNVTTVGVLSADSMLNLPFFNSGERTFQLLTQVSGRAGRSSKKGYVYIQTFEPDNFIINTSKNYEFDNFIEEELCLRKEFLYPPFVNIINICTISRDEDLMKKVAFEKYNILKDKIQEFFNNKGVLLYNPTPHAIYKLNNEYRMNLYIKISINKASQLRKIIRDVYMSKDIKNIKISINIDTEGV